jgi:hypothetical protein
LAAIDFLLFFQMSSGVRTVNGGGSKMGQFMKGLSPEFLNALAQLAKKGGWWKDVLADKQLIIGIRNEKLDVYWHGQSILNVGFGRDGVKVTTH